ncbi:hypothetical protein AAC387_Pa01g0657 [Persea americana]
MKGGEHVVIFVEGGRRIAIEGGETEARLEVETRKRAGLAGSEGGRGWGPRTCIPKGSERRRGQRICR